MVICSVLSMMALALITYLSASSTTLMPDKARAFSSSAILVALMLMLDAATTLTDAAGLPGVVWGGILNTVGFIVSPFIPLVLARASVFPVMRNRLRLLVPLIPNIVLAATTVWTGWLFSYSTEGVYTRGPLFSVYVCTCVYTIGLLLYCSVHGLRHLRPHDRAMFASLILIIATGIIAQLVQPAHHTIWPAISLALVFYYIFFRELQFKYDPLTGVYNRSAFDRRIYEMETHEDAVLAVLDILMFKQVNDLYGHAEGDRCLCLVASTAESSLEGLGDVYRSGGDELCAIACDCSVEEMEQALSAMSVRLDALRSADPKVPWVSYGVAVYHKDSGESIDAALRRADLSMYEHKRRQCEKAAIG